MDKNSKGVYFVGIEGPSILRKELLGIARGSIVSLKKYEKIKTNRVEKVEQLAILRGHVREINVLVNQLRNLLPETKIRQIPVPAKQKKPEPEPVTKAETQKQKKSVPKAEPVKQYTELDKLERELSLIEKKLSTIK